MQKVSQHYSISHILSELFEIQEFHFVVKTYTLLVHYKGIQHVNIQHILQLD